MKEAYFEDLQYQGATYGSTGLAQGEYNHCSFDNCDFQHTDLSGLVFSDCVFSDCDLSMAKLHGTAFRDVQFKRCKMLGLRFDDCNPFSLSFGFDACSLQFASFYKLKLAGTRFHDCKLEEVEFAEADLTKAVFSRCDLIGAVFDRTTLEAADFRTAMHFAIDPETNRLQKAKFSSANLAGLLHKYKIIIES